MGLDAIRTIISAYDDGLIRAYSRIRFAILRQRFLDEIGQYLPDTGPILDVGCGFGLFSIYYALTGRARTLHGIDLSAHRLERARLAAGRLGLTNVTFERGDAVSYTADPAARYAAIYMLDLIHHIPPPTVPTLLEELRRSLQPGGVLLIKDVDSRPLLKMWFTWALDKAMSPRGPVRYWSAQEVVAALRATGFQVVRHAMVDILPYPHVLYVCRLT